MTEATSATLSHTVIAAVKERIIAWQYPPEHRLTEEALCREFGISRSPVREALHVLATNGFIRRLDNRGYAVRQVKLRDLEELYDVRLALELFAIEALTTQGAPDDELAALAATWQTVGRNPPRDVAELAALDAQFHERLARLAGNGLLLQQLEGINERLFVFRTIDFGRTDRVQTTCAEHLAILDRVGARDVAGARAALYRNIAEGRAIVGESIQEALARAYAGG
jgi:DNA-binding GntR family transcriptional regulator